MSAWRVLKSLALAIFFSARTVRLLLTSKKSTPASRSGAANPFVDPDGYKKYVAEKEQEFRTELAKQKLATK